MKNSFAASDALALTFSSSQLISMEMLILRIGTIFCQQPPRMEAEGRGLGGEARLFQGFDAVPFNTTTLLKWTGVSDSSESICFKPLQPRLS